MHDAQKLFAEVHRQHAEVYCRFTQRHVCTCEQWDDTSSIDHSEHFAAELDDALGGLTREVSQATRMCSYPGSGGPCEGKAHGRWVSPWTPEETP